MTAAVYYAPASGRSWLPRWFTSEHPLPWLLPATALMIIFGIYPLIYALWLSLHKRNPVLRKNVFDPKRQLAQGLCRRARMERDVTTRSSIPASPWSFSLSLGLAIALLLDTDRKGYGVLRALMTLPLVVPPAVTAMMFLLMLDGSFGVLSRSLYALGLLSPQYPILATSSTALGRRAARRYLAMDALHGADHAGGLALLAEGALRGRRHRRRHAPPRPSSA